MDSKSQLSHWGVNRRPTERSRQLKLCIPQIWGFPYTVMADLSHSDNIGFVVSSSRQVWHPFKEEGHCWERTRACVGNVFPKFFMDTLISCLPTYKVSQLRKGD
ncbi:hypothetical protein F5Y15DRAFT_382032 [Xylariaceae sp. FL0016]|nr:hypothetical protein F5Y15DRAFT_382032 [Xylariaceae sp. FL0016]